MWRSGCKTGTSARRRRGGGARPSRHEYPARVRGDPWTLLALGVAGVFCAVTGYREVFSPDLGFYLATGRDILAAGGIPRLDTLTWTRADAAYVNLWWLYQLGSHAAWSLGGTALVRVVHLALVGACLALAVVRARERTGRIPAAAAGLVLLFGLANTWEARPHVASWLFLSVTLWVLERDARGAASRGVWVLPAVSLVWINTHALFVLGFVVLGAHGLERLLDPERRREWRLYAVGAAMLAACLANPFLLDGLLLPLEQLAILRGSAFTSAEVGIAEYRALLDVAHLFEGERPAWFAPHSFAIVYAALAVAGVAGAWRTLRASEVLLLVAFGWLFVSAIRNFGFFFLVSFPVVASGLDALGRRAAARWRRADPRRASQAALAVAGVVLIALALHGRLFAWEGVAHRLGGGWNASFLPVELSRFMLEHRIRGRLLNSWNDGGYLAFATGQKTFIDGRMEVMGDDLYAEYLRLKDPDTIRDALARIRPEVAVVPHDRIPLWAFTFSQELGWRMVYADDTWALFLAPGVMPWVPEADRARPRPGRDYPVIAPYEVRDILDAERDEGRPGLAALWAGRDAFPTRAVRRSGFYFQTGAPAAAAAIALAALRDTPFAVPDLYLNAGYALLQAGDRANADRAFAIFAQTSRVPEDVARVTRLRARLRQGR